MCQQIAFLLSRKSRNVQDVTDAFIQGLIVPNKTVIVIIAKWMCLCCAIQPLQLIYNATKFLNIRNFPSSATSLYFYVPSTIAPCFDTHIVEGKVWLSASWAEYLHQQLQSVLVSVLKDSLVRAGVFLKKHTSRSTKTVGRIKIQNTSRGQPIRWTTWIRQRQDSRKSD